jgi:hypothetical protein
MLALGRKTRAAALLGQAMTRRGRPTARVEHLGIKMAKSYGARRNI